MRLFLYAKYKNFFYLQTALCSVVPEIIIVDTLITLSSLKGVILDSS